MSRTIRLALTLLLTTSTAHAALPRYPNERGGQIVFVADGNLWQVATTGGTAHRLTSDAGQDMFPRYSPDGKWIAFTASYQGNVDVYVIPAAGGTARRLTFQSDIYPKTGGRHGPDNMVVTWTPDSKNIVFLSRRMAWNAWIARLFTVPVAGGLPQPLPLDNGGLMTYAPDGKSIAYNRIFRNFRTWKRYQGGLAQQVFTYDFDAKKLTQITDWKGTNTAPMWAGRKIYYLSDAGGAWRQNIWVYDLDSKQTRQVTKFTDYDIDFPSLGEHAITFQQGGKLYALDLPDEKLREVKLAVPDDGVRTQPRTVKLAHYVRDTDMAQQTDYALSPNGKRALLSARGDIFSVPVEDGSVRNLTSTSGIDEDHPTWSPDGKLIAYTTDRTGTPQIAVRPAAGGGGEKIITHFANGYLYGPLFAPDGKTLAFSDSEHRLWLAGMDGAAPRQVAQDGYGEIHDQAFSPDARYLAYSTHRDAQQHQLWIYDIAAGHATPVPDPLSDDGVPAFSPDGKYLYFLSARHENPAFSDTEFNFATLKSTGILAIPLVKDGASPFAPRSDEGAIDAKKPDAPDWKPGAAKPIHIDFDNMIARAVAVPVDAGNIASLDIRGTKLFYQTQPLQLLEGNLPGEKAALHIYDLEKRKDEVVTEGLDNYSLSADGKKVLVKQEKTWSVIDAAAGGGKDGKDDDKDGKKTLKLDALHGQVDATAEWSELFDNAWRLERDFFYSSQMNGVDWQQVHDSYRKLLPLAGSREDVNYLVGQVLGELGNSHTYVGGGDDADPTDDVHTALLGVDFAVDTASGRYRLAKIYPGDNTRAEYRSPLTEPGINAHEGDYLLALNGTELKSPQNPYSLLVGITPDETVTLTLSDTATGKRRDVVVQPIKSELSVREKAWIDHNREIVDRLSGGRIAYIYLSDMEQLGLQQFIRQFYGQLGKQALIIDDRWNGGGFIDQMVLERLRRVLVGLGVNRERTPTTTPQQLIDGPKICLINHYSASDGDIFPYYFKQYGLGQLLGTRTWGGVRGIRGEWHMMDNGFVTIPEDAIYNLASQWVIENHGVDPDIELENQPGDLVDGHDKQLEKAVELLTAQIANKRPGLPAPPAPLPAYPPSGNVPGPGK